MDDVTGANPRPHLGPRRRVRALIVDDNEDDVVLLREVCRELAEIELHCDHEAEAERGLRRALADGFDVICLDYQLPGLDGVAWMERYQQAGGAAPVIALTGAGDEYVAADITRAGAVAYLNKADLSPERLEAVFDRALAEGQKRGEAFHQRAAARKKVETLTAREREVLVHVAAGLTTQQIATHLHRSYETVKDHRAAALRKLGATTSAEAVRIADLAE